MRQNRAIAIPRLKRSVLVTGPSRMKTLRWKANVGLQRKEHCAIRFGRFLTHGLPRLAFIVVFLSLLMISPPGQNGGGRGRHRVLIKGLVEACGRICVKHRDIWWLTLRCERKVSIYICIYLHRCQIHWEAPGAGKSSCRDAMV